ncbi:superoxide dismutase [Bacillus testis]|uniref:superoxide dismutase n=1 Tax=Bacillus testis TaxID=1622072 RepID=UPI00067E6834|nr:superoxide dismutase [Bacillus testis]
MSVFKDYVDQVQGWLVDVKDYLAEQRISNEGLQSQLDEIERSLQADYKQKEEILALQDKVKQVQADLRGEVEGQEARQQSVPAGQHTLPPLPYPYNALEPYISEEIMRLHHDKHHQAYVDGLNKAEKMMKQARESGDFSLIKHWQNEAAFNGSGHYLHTIFWENMNPNGGGEPHGQLLKQIVKDFGSYAAFKKEFSEVAKQVPGVGWAILVWSPRARRLEILMSQLHMILTQWDTIPLLVLDVWEHAYYLQYKNKRADYVDQFWNVVYWPNVANRYEKAHKLQWTPF